MQKKIIDDHIVGIEGLWYEVERNQDRFTVTFQEHYYKRGDRITKEDEVIGTHTLLQVDKNYYLINGEAPLSGKRSVENQQIIIQNTGESVEISGDKLSLSELAMFVKPEKWPIFKLLGIYVLFLLIAAIFQFYQTYILQKASNQIVKEMRNDLFSHIQKLPIRYFVTKPAGSIVARVTNDTEAIRDLYERVLSIIVTSFVYILGIFIALFILDVKIALICLFVIPLLYVWMKLYKKIWV